MMARARALIIRNADEGIYICSNFFKRSRHGTLLLVPRRGNDGFVKEPRSPRHGEMVDGTGIEPAGDD